MRIGFDIDGTITKFYEFVKDNGGIFLNKKFKNVDFKINENGYDFVEYYDVRNNLLKNNYSIEEAIKLEKKLLNEFWMKYYIKYIFSNIKQITKSIINNLYDQDNEIFIISSRMEPINNTFLKTIITKSIVFQLKINGIKYHHLILCENDYEKIKVIKNSHIDIMVDDKDYIIEKTGLFTNSIYVGEKYNKGSNNDLKYELDLLITKLKSFKAINKQSTNNTSDDMILKNQVELSFGDKYNFYQNHSKNIKVLKKK